MLHPSLFYSFFKVICDHGKKAVKKPFSLHSWRYMCVCDPCNNDHVKLWQEYNDT